MNVDIYIRERNGSREIRIPWLPDTITYESGSTTAATYDIMNKGEVSVPTGTGLAKVSWDSIFPGKYRKDKGMLRGSKKAPSSYHKILESWMKKGTPLNVIVTGYPINLDVFIDSYSATPSGGFGDLEYSVTFIEDRDIVIKKKKNTLTKNSTSSTKRPAKKTTSYTIKRGDTLWGIAQRFLGSGAKWPSIYSLNKTIIENTAKKRGLSSSNNGWWIFPGVTIQIPSSGTASGSSQTYAYVATSSTRKPTKGTNRSNYIN